MGISIIVQGRDAWWQAASVPDVLRSQRARARVVVDVLVVDVLVVVVYGEC